MFLPEPFRSKAPGRTQDERRAILISSSCLWAFKLTLFVPTRNLYGKLNSAIMVLKASDDWLQPNLLQGPLGFRLLALRQLVQHIGGLVHPAALAAGLRPHFLDRLPEAERASFLTSLKATIAICCLAQRSCFLLSPCAAPRSSMMVTGTGPFTRTSIRKDQQSAFDLASRLLALYECQAGVHGRSRRFRLIFLHPNCSCRPFSRALSSP